MEDVTFHGRDYGRDYVRSNVRSAEERAFVIVCITMDCKIYVRDVRSLRKIQLIRIKFSREFCAGIANTETRTAKPALA